MIVASLVFGTVGLASLGGGFMGFKKAGSKASLIAGGISGALLLAASALVLGGSTTLGLGLGGVTSLLLAGRFTPAYFKTKKLMPQGMMAGLSVLALATAASGLLTL